MLTFDYADLSRMAETPKCAVMVRTREEAELFYYNFAQQYPDHIYWNLETIVQMWENNKRGVGFTMLTGENEEPESISWCDEPWFREEGYEVLEFSDLVKTVDIEEGDKPLDFLFGGFA